MNKNLIHTITGEGLNGETITKTWVNGIPAIAMNEDYIDIDKMFGPNSKYPGLKAITRYYFSSFTNRIISLFKNKKKPGK